jgi:quercetin dioxygenase-like cupin family protein
MTFVTHRIASGVLEAIEHPTWPSDLWGWSSGSWQPAHQGTHYGVVFSGVVVLRCDSGEFRLGAGMTFCVPGRLRFEGEAAVLGITQRLHRGLFQLTGPVEEVGRLHYIDGCTDSLLIPPQVRGDPCLNHLHFPPGINQTAHTHPSFRAGLVLRGSGTCRLAERTVDLLPGCAFYIPADEEHAFVTRAEGMDVIAFHPDTDFGPEHDDHPMINRTIVSGVSARLIPGIRTATAGLRR